MASGVCKLVKLKSGEYLQDAVGGCAWGEATEGSTYSSWSISTTTGLVWLYQAPGQTPGGLDCCQRHSCLDLWWVCGEADCYWQALRMCGEATGMAGEGDRSLKILLDFAVSLIYKISLGPP